MNIVALAQLFELGLGAIVVQFASHEWPQLRWAARGGLEGDPTARDTVAAVLRSAVRWYGGAGVVLFGVAGIGGTLLFGNPFTGAPLLFPVLWCAFALLTAMYLVLIPFICVAEGCGDLVSVQRMRGAQAAAVLLALWAGLLRGDALLAVWLAAAAQAVVAAVWLARRHPGLLRAPRSLPASVMKGPAGVPGRYRPEQGRSAQLWLALFLTYQSLVPILLYLRGGDESGKLGITLAVALALLLSGGVMLLPLVAPVFASRFLPLTSLVALFVAGLASLLLQAMAGWLRAFRDEQLAAPIVGGAVAVVLISAVAAALDGVRTMTLAFAVAMLGVALPIAGAHFRRVRRQRLA